ncbi:MAG: hypothetical protein Q4A15_12700 [Prevotellaceae bacterium]|nr:hypothetical protein [Prevotellaceae bacterium]
MKKAVDILIDYIMRQNREGITEKVYSRPETDAYDRTNEFLDAFSVADPTEGYMGDMANGAFDYDPTKISFNHAPVGEDNGKGGHGGYAEDLIDFIYKGHRGIWTVEARNAYAYLKKTLTKAQFKALFEMSMSEAGIPWKRSTGGVDRKEVTEL